MNENDIQKRLEAAFGMELEERLTAIAGDLVKLEQAEPAAWPALLEALFRNAHSLKGAARAVGRRECELIFAAIEEVFARMRSGALKPAPDVFDALHAAIHLVESLSADASLSAKPDTAAGVAACCDAMRRLGGVVSPGASPPPARTASPSAPPPPVATPPSTPASPAPAAEAAPAGLSEKTEKPAVNSVRVSVDKLDRLINKAEELISLKLLLSELNGSLSGAFEPIREWGAYRNRADPGIRFLRERVDALHDQGVRGREYASLKGVLDFLEWNRVNTKRLERDGRHLLRDVDARQRHLNRMIDDFLDEVKRTAMVTFSAISDLFPRMIREIAREQGKKVVFRLEGQDVELDRRILEVIKSPLIHALRNAIDHGIESPEARRAAGKPEEGQIALSVKRTAGNRVEIRVTDDGAGIPVDELKAGALRKGLITRAEAEAMSREEALRLVLRSGLSSSHEVTALSGRGLGCAIIEEGVESLGGSIAIESESGRGSSFVLRLPVSLSAFRGVLIHLGEETCVLPNIGIAAVVRVKREAIRPVENRETLLWSGRPVPLVSLRKLLGYPDAVAVETPQVVAVVMSSGDKTVAFRVDRVSEELEILVKPMGPQLRRVRHVDGAAILGSGKIVPVLNPRDLVRSAVAAPGRFDRMAEAAPAAVARKSILVVEDSITTRTLLKTILEAEGFAVKTAVDGVDGLAVLRQGGVDLVICDVEMPRMDGFQFTRAARGDAAYRDLPIVLCTSRAGQDDKEMGVDAGASAYIVKGDFDQGNFIGVIRRFL